MKPVNRNPLFSQAIPQTLKGIADSFQSLIRQLLNVFGEYAQRINNLYPKDGSENMEYITLTSSVSAPAVVSSKAFIYIDSSDGDLKVKFKNGDVQVIATVSV